MTFGLLVDYGLEKSCLYFGRLMSVLAACMCTYWLLVMASAVVDVCVLPVAL